MNSDYGNLMDNGGELQILEISHFWGEARCLLDSRYRNNKKKYVVCTSVLLAQSINQRTEFSSSYWNTRARVQVCNVLRT